MVRPSPVSSPKGEEEGFLIFLLQRKRIYSSIFIARENGGFRQVVKASDCGSDMREFDPHNPPIYQMTFLKRHFLLILLGFQGF